MDSYIRTHVNRTGRWIRKHMRGNKEERPEQVLLGEEIMQFLVKRETSLADAVDALTTLMLNVLARNYGKRDEFSRFYEEVSTFLGPTERDLAVVAWIPLPGAAKAPPRTVTMVEQPEGILRLATEVGEQIAKRDPKASATVSMHSPGRCSPPSKPRAVAKGRTSSTCLSASS
jgi:hypothetical protein